MTEPTLMKYASLANETLATIDARIVEVTAQAERWGEDHPTVAVNLDAVFACRRRLCDAQIEANETAIAAEFDAVEPEFAALTEAPADPMVTVVFTRSQIDLIDLMIPVGYHTDERSAYDIERGDPGPSLVMMASRIKGPASALEDAILGYIDYDGALDTRESDWWDMTPEQREFAERSLRGSVDSILRRTRDAIQKARA